MTILNLGSDRLRFWVEQGDGVRRSLLPHVLVFGSRLGTPTDSPRTRRDGIPGNILVSNYWVRSRPGAGEEGIRLGREHDSRFRNERKKKTEKPHTRSDYHLTPSLKELLATQENRSTRTVDEGPGRRDRGIPPHPCETKFVEGICGLDFSCSNDPVVGTRCVS